MNWVKDEIREECKTCPAFKDEKCQWQGRCKGEPCDICENPNLKMTVSTSANAYEDSVEVDAAFCPNCGRKL